MDSHVWRVIDHMIRQVERRVPGFRGPDDEKAVALPTAIPPAARCHGEDRRVFAVRAVNVDRHRMFLPRWARASWALIGNGSDDRLCHANAPDLDRSLSHGATPCDPAE